MDKHSQLALFEVAYFAALFHTIQLVHFTLQKAQGPLGWIWNVAAVLAVVAFGVVLAVRPRLVATVR